MPVVRICLLLVAIVVYIPLQAQDSLKLKRDDFFADDAIFEMDLTTDLRFLSNKKPDTFYVPGTVTMRMPDGKTYTAPEVGVRARGKYRKENCDLASLMFQFNLNKKEKHALSNLKKLKFVAGCTRSMEVDQLVLKEYLIYKMYNLYSPMSFKVRMAKVRFNDVNKKMKSYTQYAFFIEDVDDMAERNGMVEKYNHGFRTEQSNRPHTTLVCMFQYMIGNTDWAVPAGHNVKLLAPQEDTMRLPFLVPYDFDYAGLVNAEYAVPHEDLGIDAVTTRLYRGFPRTLEELRPVADKFRENKEATEQLIKNFSLLNNMSRNAMLGYIDDFYKEIKDDQGLTRAFIKNARTQ